MINLLLPEDQKRLAREYQRLVTSAYLLVLIAASGILLVFFALISGLLSWRSAHLKEQLILINQNQATSTKPGELDSATLGQFISRLQASQSVVSSPGDLVIWFSAHRPAGITLRSFLVEDVVGASRRLELRGLASTRQAMVAYLDFLHQTPGISAVESPITNLVKESKIDFSLTVTITGPLSTISQ